MAENGGYANPVLVTTDWLADHLGDEAVVAAEVDENVLGVVGHIATSVEFGESLSELRSFTVGHP